MPVLSDGGDDDGARSTVARLDCGWPSWPIQDYPHLVGSTRALCRIRALPAGDQRTRRIDSLSNTDGADEKE